MKRYNAVCGGVYDNSVMVEETDGDWVWYEDVEAKCAELDSKCAELLNAAKLVVERWDSPLWRWEGHTGVLVTRLRKAIAKAEGGEG